MSFLVIKSEYDMDLALKETMKLIELKDSEINLGFNTREMAHIYLGNLYEMCEKKKIKPESKSIRINILLEKVTGEENDTT